MSIIELAEVLFRTEGINYIRSKRYFFFSHSLFQAKESVKRATKLYFTHYSCVVIILFNTGL